MPNHCSQHFSFTGSQKDIQQLYRHIVNAEGERPVIDFNRIIPMSEALDIENTNQGQTALALLQANPNQSVINTDLFPHAYQLIQVLSKYGFEWQSLTVGQAILVLENESDLQQHFGLDFTLGRQYQQNLQQYGHFSWYHWRLQHWGTKWNAYNCEMELSEDGLMDEEYTDEQIDALFS